MSSEREYPDKYGISEFLWKIHPGQGCYASALYITIWGTCEELFSLTISKILCMRPNSLGLGVPYLKHLLGVVGFSRMFSLMDWYFMGRHMRHQEYLLPMGLHHEIQYLSTTKVHQVMGKLLWYGGNFSSFMQLYHSPAEFCL